MADAARIQSKIWHGYGQAAKRLGFPFAQYRPTDPMDPLAAAALLNPALPVAFVQNFDFGQPGKYGTVTWKALADGSVLAPGDYLVGTAGTFYIADKDAMLPMMAVQCNRVLTVRRAPAITGAGVRPYGGATQANEVTLMAGWPSCVEQGTKGQMPTSALPGDTRAPWWSIYLPAIAGVTLQYGDVMADDIGRTYTVSSAELSDAGWRIAASQSEV
jgi:hypothetical protein